VGDVLLYAESNTQQILIGAQQDGSNSRAALTVIPTNDVTIGYQLNSDYVNALEVRLQLADHAFSGSNDMPPSGYLTTLVDTSNTTYTMQATVIATSNQTFGGGVNPVLTATSNLAYTDSAKLVLTSNLAYADSAKLVLTSNLAYADSSKLASTSNLAYADSAKLASTSNLAYADSAKLTSTSNLAYADSVELASTSNLAYAMSNFAYADSAKLVLTSNLAYADSPKLASTSNLAYAMSNFAYATSNLAYADSAKLASTSNLAYATSNLAYAASNQAFSIATLNASTSSLSFGKSNVAFVADGALLTIGSNANQGYPLEVQTVSSLGDSISIYSAGDISALSDLRVKTDLQVIDNALSKMDVIHGYTYLRRNGAVEGVEQRRCAGVIAQEMQFALPEVVSETPDGLLHVAYGNIAALLIQATKELAASRATLTVTTTRPDEQFCLSLPDAQSAAWASAVISPTSSYSRCFVALSEDKTSVRGRCELPGTFTVVAFASPLA
jgi:hypothetical protein